MKRYILNRMSLIALALGLITTLQNCSQYDFTSVLTADETADVDNDSFITKWETTAPNEDVTIPVAVGSVYNYTVDWGEGTTSADQTGAVTHSYATAGIQTITISKAFPRINFQDKTQLKSIEQWGTTAWESMEDSFRGCSNLTAINATDNLDLSNVTNLTNMFALASTFNQDISGWDVSNVTNMSGMFALASTFNQDISSWDVANITNMTGMFNRASAFDQNIGDWDVSNVTKMNFLFLDAKLSTANYNALLIGWAKLSLKRNVAFHGGNSKFSADATAARSKLISDYNWGIQDSGVE